MIKDGNQDLREILRHMGLVTQIGMMMVSCIIISFFIGYGIDSYTTRFPLFTLVFVILGVLSGMWSVYKLIMRKMR